MNSPCPLLPEIDCPITAADFAGLVLSHGVGPDLGSDHRAVVVDIALP